MPAESGLKTAFYTAPLTTRPPGITAERNIIRLLFKSHLRDHNCGLKVIRSHVVKDMELISDSAFIGAEIIINAMVKGYPIGEAGIKTYPRTFGESSVMSFPHITNSIKDMFRVYRKIFKN